jgi:hypothetical protein
MLDAAVRGKMQFAASVESTECSYEIAFLRSVAPTDARCADSSARSGLTVLSQERDLAQRIEQTRPPCRRVAAQGASVFTTDARNSNMQSAFGGAHLRRLRTVPKIVRYLGHKIGSNSMRQAGGHARPRLPPAGAVKSVPQSPWPVRLKRWFDRTPPSPETDHDHQGTLLPNVSSDKVYGSLYRPRLPRPLSRRRGLP